MKRTAIERQEELAFEEQQRQIDDEHWYLDINKEKKIESNVYCFFLLISELNLIFSNLEVLLLLNLVIQFLMVLVLGECHLMVLTHK